MSGQTFHELAKLLAEQTPELLELTLGDPIIQAAMEAIEQQGGNGHPLWCYPCKRSAYATTAGRWMNATSLFFHLIACPFFRAEHNLPPVGKDAEPAPAIEHLNSTDPHAGTPFFPVV